MAPRAGLGTATTRLTAERSTIELSRDRRGKYYFTPFNNISQDISGFFYSKNPLASCFYWMTQLTQGFSFNLPNPLPGYTEDLANLFQGSRPSVFQTKA